MNTTRFETSDYCLAASLIAAVGALVLEVNFCDDGQPRFTFADDGVLCEVAHAYLEGSLRVDPIIFCSAQRYLRSLIRDLDEASRPGACRDFGTT